jgi:hypothetical protein
MTHERKKIAASVPAATANSHNITGISQPAVKPFQLNHLPLTPDQERHLPQENYQTCQEKY